MLFKQLFDQETWTYTYLIADPISKDALLIRSGQHPYRRVY